ncbi:MAG: hypothetical protein IJM23_09060 [Lachnospiraceae bacterium]|nr:hypothetical protein [Lachnospiraceae bacterium]
MDNKKDIRFFPIFLGATAGILLEVIAALVVRARGAYDSKKMYGYVRFIKKKKLFDYTLMHLD